MHHEHKSCIDACLECALECQHCGTACIDENRPESAKLCLQCADICYAAAAAMGGGAQYAQALCGICAETCDNCASECEKHAEVEHCRHCAEVCRRCADECRAMAGLTARAAASISA